jgi:pimeloyl-ACP methyl ester carboxylesterase
MRAAGLLALAVLGAGCRFGYVGDYTEQRPKQALRHRARTADGWELALVEYRPVGPATGRPVLLLHGICANDRQMDLDDKHSLARWFASKGRPAWTLSLRNSGDSDRKDWEQGRHGGFDLDTLWRQDLATAVAYVRKQTGAPLIDFVGHSLGGLIAYAYLAEGGGGIGAAVTLGSPVRLDWGLRYDPYLRRAAGLVSNDWSLPVVAPSVLALPFNGIIADDPVQLLIYNPENVTDQTLKRIMAMGMADVSAALAVQLSELIGTGRFLSADHQLDYRKDMARISTPVLVVAGKLDRLGVTPAVKAAYRALGGPKEWLLVGQETGAQADYGHIDFIMGERAPQEVWPRLLDFLDRHATP